MATTNTMTTAEGLAKPIFGTVKDVRPDKGRHMLEDAKFAGNMKLGEQFQEPVWLTDEGGFTYDSGAGTDFTINDGEAAESQKATLDGAEMVLRSTVAYKNFSAHVNGPKASFESFYKRLALNMRKSFSKRLEISALHGGSPLGIQSTETGSGTDRVYTLTTASWAPGIWGGCKNHRIDFYDGSTLLNDVQDVVIVSADFTNRTITVTGEATDLTAIDGATNPTIYWKGAKGAEMTGMMQLAQLGSGDSYLGIDVDDYPDFWQPTTVAVGGNLTWAKIEQGMGQIADRGCEGNVRLQVSHATWSNLNGTQLAGLRAIDSSFSANKTSLGTKQIEYISACGTVTVTPSRFMKQGEAVAYLTEGTDLKRVGSTDITFTLPDMGGKFFRHVTDKAAVEVRAYSDQALYTTDLKNICYYSGITN